MTSYQVEPTNNVAKLSDLNADLAGLDAKIDAISTGNRAAGNFDASAGTFPLGSNTGTFYVTSVAGTVDGEAFAVGDLIWPLIADASTSTFEGNWARGDISALFPAGFPVRFFGTVAELFADNTMGYASGGSVTQVISDGDEIVAGGYRYSVAGSGATDHAKTTAGGVKLHVLQGADGAYRWEAFGPALDNATDDSASMASTMAYLLGKSTSFVLSWSGVGLISSALDADDYTGDIEWRAATPGSGLNTTTDDISIVKGAPSSPPNVTLRGLSLTGAWKDNNQQSTADNWLFHIEPCAHLQIIDCEIGSSQKGGVKAGNSEKVTMTGTRIYECARGGINVSGTRDVLISGNRFEHLNDDAISLHSASGAAQVNRDHVVTGNHFEDCQGIAALGATNLVVSNNTGDRVRTRFFYGGLDSTFNEGLVSATGISITGNIVNTIISNGVFSAGTQNRAIYIAPPEPTAGSEAAAPGENDTATGDVIAPWDSFQNVADPIAGNWFITIANNSFIRTRDAVSAYSDWGEGLLFDEDGYIDPAVTDADLETTWLLEDGIRDMLVAGNRTYGLEDVRFFFGSDLGFRRVKFTNNTWARASSGSLLGFGGSASNKYLDLVIDGDTFDGDPFHEHSARGVNGTWTAANDLRAINLAGVSGFQVRNCDFKNVSEIFNVTGSGFVIDRNRVYQQAFATGFSTSNEGVGRGYSPQEGYIHIWVSTDTTSNDWGWVTNGTRQYASSMPTSGNYIKGQVVRNTGSSAYTPSSSRILYGWVRATDCDSSNSNHVLNTDWFPIYMDTA